MKLTGPGLSAPAGIDYIYIQIFVSVDNTQKNIEVLDHVLLAPELLLVMFVLIHNNLM